MPRPTESEKKAKNTEETMNATITGSDGVERAVEIIAKTKPNQNGGYDTEIHVPKGHVGVRRINPGGIPS